jgi:hypothetical protein
MVSSAKLLTNMREKNVLRYNNIVTCLAEGRRCYATQFSLLRNRGRVVPWIRSPLGIVVLHDNQQ